MPLEQLLMKFRKLIPVEGQVQCSLLCFFNPKGKILPFPQSILKFLLEPFRKLLLT